MAATRLIALHINKGKTIAQTLADRTDYSKNEEKTEGGKYISSYECDARTADEEFLLSKRQYEHATGRNQEHNIIAYQIRQSFRPGEITPEEANRIGYELGMRFTKGRHAFIVATHTDRAHIHNHIIFNSTSLDCTRKFKNFFLSSFALQRISDRLCLEHGLSIIEPRPYRERNKRTEYPKRTSNRDDLRAAIDTAMQRHPKDFDELISFLAEAGYEYKPGKRPSLRCRGHDRFARFSSLGEGYTVDDLKDALSGKRRERSTGKSRQIHDKKFSLLIDIQAKLKEGKGIGYQRWATLFNLKQMAQVLCFLQENKIGSIDELSARTDAAVTKFNGLGDSIKAAEQRMQEIAALKKHIINYSKTRESYVAYRKAGYSKQFLEEHREAITLHKAAKEAFEQLGLKKLPRVKELNAEYAQLLEQKRAAYPAYRKARTEMQEYLVAQKVAALLLDQEKEQAAIEERRKEEQRTDPHR
jgi:hypothetical protein